MSRVTLALALLALPGVALACPVCGGGGQNQQAFIDMTIFLSILPLTLAGGLGLVLWRLHSLAEAEEDERPDPPPQRRGGGGPSSSESPAAM